MNLYITAQLVGFLGFLLLTGAPYLKTKDNFIKVEILASILLSLQWLMLAQPGLAIINILNIALSIGALRATTCTLTDKAMPLFYPLSLLVILLVSKGTIVDAFCIIGFFSFITSKKAKDIRTFRSYAMVSTIAFTISGYLALSIPSIIFGTICSLSHAYKLIELHRFDAPCPQNI